MFILPYNGISWMSTTVSFQCTFMCTTRSLPARYLPCHHFHAYTHTHLHVSIRSDYIDISRKFYSDPEGWFQGKFPNANAPLPSHLVLFDVLVPVSSSLCKPKFLFVIVCIYFSVESCYIFIQVPLWRGNRLQMFILHVQSNLDYPNSRCKENSGSKCTLWPRDWIAHAQ